jgi:uncharacterized protein YecT (DUF1311 family)
MACIETIAGPCIGDESAAVPSQVIACLDKEQAAWNEILNEAFRVVRDGGEPPLREKLRAMQRSWIDTREWTCAFYYDYFEGSMANPMMANCQNRETALRAIFLKGFADDTSARKP